MDQIDKSLWINKLWDPLEKIDDSPLHSKREGIKVAAYCRVSLDSLGPVPLVGKSSKPLHPSD